MFALTEEQTLIRETAGRYLADNFDFTARQKALALGYGLDRARWQEFAEMGWLGLPFAEELGGAGGTLMDAAILCEQFGRFLMMTPYATAVAGAGHVLARTGASPDLLAGLISGKCVLACALTDGDGAVRTDTLGQALTLSGTKIAAPFAGDADHLLVSAEGGTVLCLIPASDAKISTYRTYDGAEAGDVTFTAAAVPPSMILSTDADTLSLLEDTLTALACAEASGIMWALQEQTLEYLKTREQFGNRLSSFQALQHRLVDVYVTCQLAQSMAWDAVAALEDGCTPEERSRRVSAAKAFVSEAGRKLGQECVQLHGGIGMTDEIPVGHGLKRLTAISIQHGDAPHHRRRFRRLDPLAL
ncbi:MAG: acyl-CoA dehydrogenase [Pseudomonadota bacterium]